MSKKLKWEKKVDKYKNTHYISSDNTWDIVKVYPYTNIYRVYDLIHPRFITRLSGGYLPEERIETREKTFNVEFEKLSEAKKWIEDHR